MQHSERVDVVLVFVCVCMCVCVCVCVSACVYVCVFVRVYVLGRERSWVFPSTALVVVWTAMYLTGYSDYLTGFHHFQHLTDVTPVVKNGSRDHCHMTHEWGQLTQCCAGSVFSSLNYLCSLFKGEFCCRTVRIWDLSRPFRHKGIMKPKGQGGRRVVPTACVYSNDGRYMTAACQDGSIQLWDHNKHTFVSNLLQV